MSQTTFSIAKEAAEGIELAKSPLIDIHEPSAGAEEQPAPVNNPSHPQPAEKNEGGEGQETRAAANHAANNHEQLAEGQCRFINKTEKRKAEKQAIIAAIQDCAEKLGETPSYPKLKSMAGIRLHRILALFGNYTQAIRESGLKGHGSGHPQNIEALFEDWAEIVRKLGKVPTRTEYELHSTNSHRPLMQKFNTWSNVPQGLKLYAEESGIEGDWKDVLEITKQHLEGPFDVAETPVFANVERNRPKAVNRRRTFGDPLAPLPMAHAPTCEAGVVFLFGKMAGELGFMVRRMQTAFPDCEAMRRIGENQWEDVRIELEFVSRNFQVHGHDPQECDMIVCWEHNWPECPLEVVELRSKLRNVLEWQKIDN